MMTFTGRDARISVATSAYPRWGVRLTTLAVWAAVTASLAYWVLQWPQSGGGRGEVATTVAADDVVAAAPAAAAMARALGAVQTLPERAAAPSLSSRLSLVGVVRAGARDGAAILAVDGKSPRPVRVGAEVEPGLYLLALEPRLARLGPDLKGAETLVLELPRPKAP